MRRAFIISAVICAAACAVCFLLSDGGALSAAAWTMLAAAVVLAVVAAVAAVCRRSKIPPVPTDPDPSGTRFTTQLTEMMDTISRATAERECGISTQMLYEQARFCEPCTDPAARETERGILTAITEMHPDDPDEVITQKCTAVLRLLEKRERFF